MISDVLSEAVAEIDRYLDWDRDGPGTYFYDGEIRQRIIRCRNEMERIRAKLDTPSCSMWMNNAHLLNEDYQPEEAAS